MNSFSSKLGSQFGAGIAQGLSQLAENKVRQQLNQQETQKRASLWKSLGLSDQDAIAFGNAPDAVQKTLLDRLQGLEVGAGGQQQPQQQSSPLTPENAAEEISMATQQEPQGKRRLTPHQEEQLLSHQESKKAPKTLQLGGTLAERSKEQAAINKEVRPYIAEVQNKAKGAKENNLRLNRMESLIKSGKINNPTWASALKTLKHGIFGVGIDLEGLLSPESQEFNKLTQDFVKNAKDVFGSRITDTDLKSFLATIPNLSQSNKGKASVIKNLKLLNEADELRNIAARKLAKKYGSSLPIDFASEVEDLIKPELDAIAKRFSENTEAEVPSDYGFNLIGEDTPLETIANKLKGLKSK